MPFENLPDLVPVLPEIFLALVIMSLLMFGVFQRGGRAETDVNTFRVISWMAVVTLIVTPLLVLSLAGSTLIGFGGLFISDPFSVFCKILVLIGSAGSLVMARNFLEEHDMARFEYPVLVVFATLGMLMMISANDLISLYMGLEMQSLSLYVIAAFRRDDTRSTEAGLKYFVLGAVASGMFLYGASLIYGFAGTTNFTILEQVLQRDTQDEYGQSLGIIFGIVFILSALAFKVSAVPFHMWTPDVYEGAPTPVTALFAIAPKIAALALFMRVMVGPFGDLISEWRQIIIFISVGSMLLGALAAINQRNIKRMMAYSSISHVGFALMGLAVGHDSGIRAILVYLTIYLFMNIGTFACILAMRRGGVMVEAIDELAGLGKTHPLMAAAMTVFMFSMAGIPPLAGFFGKLYIFLSVIQAELYLLAVIGVLTSVVGSFYYLRVIRLMYFEDPDEPLDRPVSREISLIATLAGLVTVLFFLYPDFLVLSAATASSALFLN